MLIVQLISAMWAMMCVSEWRAVGGRLEIALDFCTNFSAFSVSQESQVLQFTVDVWCCLTCKSKSFVAQMQTHCRAARSCREPGWRSFRLGKVLLGALLGVCRCRLCCLTSFWYV